MREQGPDWAEVLRRVAVTPDCEHLDRARLLADLEGVLDRGFSACMFREKRLGEGAFGALGAHVRAAVERRGGAFILNERLSQLEALRPSFFHATFRSPPLETIRDRAREIDLGELRVGVSVHDEAEAKMREAEGFDYLVFGPIFETPSKRGLFEARGLERLGELCRELSVPVVAIGGIGLEHEVAVREAGADGVAMMRAAFSLNDEESS
jgi:thiamine-phosphate pyrophosphorylase